MARPRPSGLPRARRIRKRPDFVRIQNSGLRATTRHLLILIAAPTAAPANAEVAGRSPGATPDGTRLGLVASRKVGGAVARNRGKRLVREAFRRFPELFPGGVDVVVILRAGVSSLGLDDVASELRGVAHVLRRRAREAHGRSYAPTGGGPAAPPRTPEGTPDAGCGGP